MNLEYTLSKYSNDFGTYEAVKFKEPTYGFDYIEFLIEWNDNGEYNEFVIHNVHGWNVETNLPDDLSDYDKYIKGYIKNDGCSHIWFGSEDGYLHLCGKDFFEQHCKILNAIYDICSKRIKEFKH